MQQRFRSRYQPAGNPLASVLVVVVGILTIAVFVIVGFIAFVALAGFMLAFALSVGVRAWWMRRGFRGSARVGSGARGPGEGDNGGGAVIDAEYRIVSREKHRD